jgi:hypothetical protein
MKIALAVACAIACAAAGPEIIDIFTAGVGGYACYRVPAAVRRPSDSALLVFVEARRPSCDDQAPKDIGLTVSGDNGTTWSAMVRVVGSGAGNTTYRNPFPVFAADGTLVLQFVNTTAAWESMQVRQGHPGQRRVR